MFGMKQSPEADNIESLTRTMLSALVDHPKELKLHTSVSAGCILVEATAGTGDSGYLIGRNGRTADALRTIIQNAARRTGKRFVLSINGEK
jgi:uncharacterized protein